MILIVLFSIKLVSVVSVCVTPASGTSGDCSDRSIANNFDLFDNKGLIPGGIIKYRSTRNFLTIVQCANDCTNDCYYFDYDCQTGNCVSYTYDSNAAYGAATNQLFSQTGHISAFYI